MAANETAQPQSQRPNQNVTRATAALCIAGIIGGVAARWWWPIDDRTTEQSAVSGTKQLSIFVSGDTQGWIVPCGCTSNQSGGLLRRGTVVDKIAKKGAVAVLDVGGAPGGDAPYQIEKFRAILSGEREMGLAAHNIGAAEANLGPQTLRQLATELSIPFLSTNVCDDAGELIGQPSILIHKADRTLAVMGVLSPSFAAPGIEIQPPREAILAAIEPLRGKYDWLVVLAYLPELELRQLAAELPEADVVVGGPTVQSIAPVAVGPTLLAAATNKGKFVVQLNAPTKQDDSWSGEIVEISAEHADHPAQNENLLAFYQKLESIDFTAQDSGFVPTSLSHSFTRQQVAGSQSCSNCHEHDCVLWDASNHAHAWTTLEARGAHVDSYCQQCHTTGFGWPNGFQSAKRSLERVTVGCESCHGPSQSHVNDPRNRTPYIARDQCVQCHDRENSPLFEFAAYWQQIQHGSKTTSANSESKDPGQEVGSP